MANPRIILAQLTNPLTAIWLGRNNAPRPPAPVPGGFTAEDINVARAESKIQERGRWMRATADMRYGFYLVRKETGDESIFAGVRNLRTEVMTLADKQKILRTFKASENTERVFQYHLDRAPNGITFNRTSQPGFFVQKLS